MILTGTKPTLMMEVLIHCAEFSIPISFTLSFHKKRLALQIVDRDMMQFDPAVLIFKKTVMAVYLVHPKSQ